MKNLKNTLKKIDNFVVSRDLKNMTIQLGYFPPVNGEVSEIFRVLAENKTYTERGLQFRRIDLAFYSLREHRPEEYENIILINEPNCRSQQIFYLKQFSSLPRMH